LKNIFNYIELPDALLELRNLSSEVESAGEGGTSSESEAGERSRAAGPAGP
jgi:hypothetical protein